MSRIASQYFYRPQVQEEDENSQISSLLFLDDQNQRASHCLQEQNQPVLADYPLDQDQKEHSTFDVTEELDNRSEVQTESKSDVQTDIIFQQKTIEKYKEVFRGSKDDTVELNINFKTLLVHYFKELRMLNELSEFEQAHLNEFSDRVPSFPSLMLFFERTELNEGIRARSLEFFSSTECIRRIFAGRSKMKTKLQMVKFIEKLRLNILTKGKGYKWKDVVKREK